MAATAYDSLAESGIPRDSVHSFRQRHSLLRGDVRFVDAHFWTRWQRTLLVEYLEEESGWDTAVIELEELLRKRVLRWWAPTSADRAVPNAQCAIQAATSARMHARGHRSSPWAASAARIARRPGVSSSADRYRKPIRW
jgi:hypothetical protein